MSAAITNLAQLSDAELRAAQLRISDPEAQPNLVDTIPDGATLLLIENLYEAGDGWPEHKVYCARCRARRHKRGWTALLADGRRVLLGSRCGAKIFGQSWNVAIREFKQWIDRRTTLDRLHTIAGSAADIHALIGAHASTASMLRAGRSRFKNALFHLYEALSDACNTDGGQLKFFETYRDLIAEEQSRGGSARPIIRSRETVYHVVRGAEYFARLDPVQILDEAFNAVKALAELAAGDTTAVPMQRLRAVARRCAAAADQVARVELMYRGALSFFTDENLSRVAEWASLADHVPGRYKAGRGVIWRTDETGRMSLPQFPAPFSADLARLLRGE